MAAADEAGGRAFDGTSLLIVAELPPEVFAWAGALRRLHYPPDRNRLGAHVTLFHGLPPSARSEVVALLRELACGLAPEAAIGGLMDLGDGTAFVVASPAMLDMHATMASRLHGLVQQKDARPPRLHITVQAKVAAAQARALQRKLKDEPVPPAFRFRGLGLYGWSGDLWRQMCLYPFRGVKRQQGG